MKTQKWILTLLLTTFLTSACSKLNAEDSTTNGGGGSKNQYPGALFLKSGARASDLDTCSVTSACSNPNLNCAYLDLTDQPGAYCIDVTKACEIAGCAVGTCVSQLSYPTKVFCADL